MHVGLAVPRRVNARNSPVAGARIARFRVTRSGKGASQFLSPFGATAREMKSPRYKKVADSQLRESPSVTGCLCQTRSAVHRQVNEVQTFLKRDSPPSFKFRSNHRLYTVSLCNHENISRVNRSLFSPLFDEGFRDV